MQYYDDEWESFKQTVMGAARNLAQRGDHRMIAPNLDRTAPAAKPLRIGLFGNMANQAYITARALRRLGHHVDVVIQSNVIDLHHLSQPFWEETECEVGPAEIKAAPEGWVAPDFCRMIPYDMEAQIRFQNRLSAVPELVELYKEMTGRVIPDDLALLLAQWMGHWNYIQAMNEYDVVQLSTWSIVLGGFCPKPYVVLPLGGELYITAFEETVQGLLCRTGFRSANRITFPETDYPAYLDRLGAVSPREFLPLIVDTDFYVEAPEEDLRATWRRDIGGSRYLLSVCRQSWAWKGSDRLIRAFAAFYHARGGEWRLLLQAWGDDLDRSRALVRELGLDAVTAWLPMCSKPLLRARERAADAVADQFVMEGYGTSVLESMAAGKPVIMIPVPAAAEHHFLSGAPPLVGAVTVEEISEALEQIRDDVARAEAGQASRRWVENEHGHRALAARYVASFEKACGRMLDDSQPCVPETAVASIDIDFLLNRHYRQRRDEIKTKLNRTTPYADQIVDRWDKARYLGFGEEASIYDNVLVIGNVSVGDKTWIGPNCVLDGSEGVTIGSTCSISAGCQIYSHDTVAWAVSSGVASARRAKTTLENAVYLGPGTVVSAGSHIGEGSIIGALSLVRGFIPPRSFAVGCPARVVGRVEMDSAGTVTVVINTEGGASASHQLSP